jgi:hypothetical protein
MGKKIKFILSGFVIVSLLLIFALPVFAENGLGSFMSDWGKVLKEYAINKDNTSSDLFAKGNTATITNEEVKQATDFYILSGMNNEEAKIQAINYVKEREALYEMAIRNGYIVTDDEVLDYLNQLKETINTADNKEDAYAVMKSFDSEQDYWDYEFTVYQKNLPIQKYVESLQDQYESKTTLKRGTTEFLNDFNSYFNNYKKSLVEAENYQIVE